MKKISESGHVKNVANFKLLISFCTGFGSSYNPGNFSISLSSLNTMHINAKNMLNNVIAAKAAWDHATNEREIAFEPLPKLCTRIINSLEVCGASQQKMDDGRTLLNLLRGTRANKKTEETDTEDPKNTEPKKQSISVSHTSFDNKVGFMERLVQLLLTEPNYRPNETDLTIISLNSFVAQLDTLNTAAKESLVALSNARLQRDELLYLSDNCLCELALDVKKYVRSIFGATSPQFKQIGSIRFTNTPTMV